MTARDLLGPDVVLSVLIALGLVFTTWLSLQGPPEFRLFLAFPPILGFALWDTWRRGKA